MVEQKIVGEIRVEGITLVQYDSRDGKTEIDGFLETALRCRPARLFVQGHIGDSPTDLSFYFRPKTTVVYLLNTFNGQNSNNLSDVPDSSYVLNELKRQFPFRCHDGQIRVTSEGRVYQVVGSIIDREKYLFPEKACAEQMEEFVAAVRDFSREDDQTTIYALAEARSLPQGQGIVAAANWRDIIATVLPKPYFSCALDFFKNCRGRAPIKSYPYRDLLKNPAAPLSGELEAIISSRRKSQLSEGSYKLSAGCI